jgi:hypothetical protein
LDRIGRGNLNETGPRRASWAGIGGAASGSCRRGLEHCRRAAGEEVASAMEVDGDAVGVAAAWQMWRQGTRESLRGGRMTQVRVRAQSGGGAD